jgi:hypothetical protein
MIPGLEVDALGGAPGVLSARYAGPNATDEERNARLLAELGLTDDERRTARFICAIALYDPATGRRKSSKGRAKAASQSIHAGHNGFGYDPLFIPSGYAHTFGELSEDVKQQISHRSRALAAVRLYLNRRAFPDLRLTRRRKRWQNALHPNLFSSFGDAGRFTRGVAQPGSALGLGPRGRVFESLRPDFYFQRLTPVSIPLSLCTLPLLSATY